MDGGYHARHGDLDEAQDPFVVSGTAANRIRNTRGAACGRVEASEQADLRCRRLSWRRRPQQALVPGIQGDDQVVAVQHAGLEPADGMLAGVPAPPGVPRQPAGPRGRRIHQRAGRSWRRRRDRRGLPGGAWPGEHAQPSATCRCCRSRRTSLRSVYAPWQLLWPAERQGWLAPPPPPPPTAGRPGRHHQRDTHAAAAMALAWPPGARKRPHGGTASWPEQAAYC